MRKLVLIGLLTWLISGSASAAEVRVIDGDTIRIDTTTIRLWGIDAPEKGQTCERQAEQYDCGAYARIALEAFIGSTVPTCEPVNTDRYGRTVARCSVDGSDLGDWMVWNGFALDYPRHSKGRYRPLQDEAEDAQRGIWQGEFTPPWDWRRDRR